ncbi:MAG: ANTAR domain-containing response regulator [Acidimicrobiales bacterium]
MSPTRVVLAEDEALIRLDLKEILIEEGYDVVGEAGDGASALELIRDLQPDVAILDVMMPVMDGLTAAREIVAERLTAVVILTAFAQRDLVEQAREAGAMSYLVKPYRRQELAPAIELAVARFSETSALAREAASLAEQLATRKLVDRAKGILQDQLSMTEHDAFRFVQTTAMSRRTSMKVIAEAVIDGSLRPE